MPMSLFAAEMIMYPKEWNTLLGINLFLVMGFPLWDFIQLTYYDSTGFTTQFDIITHVG